VNIKIFPDFYYFLLSLYWSGRYYFALSWLGFSTLKININVPIFSVERCCFVGMG
jgi:hypothetical protein